MLTAVLLNFCTLTFVNCCANARACTEECEHSCPLVSQARHTSARAEVGLACETSCPHAKLRAVEHLRDDCSCMLALAYQLLNLETTYMLYNTQAFVNMTDQ